MRPVLAQHGHAALGGLQQLGEHLDRLRGGAADQTPAGDTGLHIKLDNETGLGREDNFTLEGDGEIRLLQLCVGSCSSWLLRRPRIQCFTIHILN